MTSRTNRGTTPIPSGHAIVTVHLLVEASNMFEADAAADKVARALTDAEHIVEFAFAVDREVPDYGAEDYGTLAWPEGIPVSTDREAIRDAYNVAVVAKKVTS